ncbi:MAG: helix-turn-helix domain-containing protein [Kiritimatiellales bacterium]|nr:helix-turn-helix domain-containing protein [Kiritimatiellales bacterium]
MERKSIDNFFNQSDIEIGKRVKKARIFLGFTQPDFAVPLGISRSKLANIETGRTILSYGLAVQLARIFIISEWWLATSEGDLRDYQNWSGIPELLNVDHSRPFLDVFAEYRTLCMIREVSSVHGFDIFQKIELVLDTDGQNAWQLWNMLQYLLSILDPRPEYPGHNDPKLVPFYRELLRLCYEYMINGMGGQAEYDNSRNRKDGKLKQSNEDVERMLAMMEKASPRLSEN